MIDYKAFKKGILEIDFLSFVRSLIILEIVGLLFSTAAAMIFETLIFLCFISSKKLRYRIISVLNEPMVVMSLILYTMIGIGIFYSVVPFWESMDMWRTWRKLLLIPMVASVYTDPLWKQRFVYIFIVIITLSSLVSFTSYIFDFAIYDMPLAIGIVVDNHATQGMIFSVAMFACIVLLRFPQPSSFNTNWLLKLSAGALFLNIVFVTPGRSGYLTLIVLIMVFIYFGFKNKSRFISLLLVPLVILPLLLASPVAKHRILEGVNQIKEYKHSPELTPMGVRIVMWKNTIQLLKSLEHPFFGYGTNGFEIAYKEQVGKEKGWQGDSVDDPHNQYLRIWVEYGLIGLILFLLFIFSFFRQNIKGPAYIMGIGVLLAWCATSMFSPHFTTSGEGRFLMIWCGAMLSPKSPKISNHGDK